MFHFAHLAHRRASGDLTNLQIGQVYLVFTSIDDDKPLFAMFNLGLGYIYILLLNIIIYIYIYIENQ
jgi:hypothetical protein